MVSVPIKSPVLTNQPFCSSYSEALAHFSKNYVEQFKMYEHAHSILTQDATSRRFFYLNSRSKRFRDARWFYLCNLIAWKIARTCFTAFIGLFSYLLLSLTQTASILSRDWQICSWFIKPCNVISFVTYPFDFMCCSIRLLHVIVSSLRVSVVKNNVIIGFVEIGCCYICLYCYNSPLSSCR